MPFGYADDIAEYQKEIERLKRKMRRMERSFNHALNNAAVSHKALLGALSDALIDIMQWKQLAERHRESLGDRADFTPYCASKNGIETSEYVIEKIRAALSKARGNHNPTL
jgi:hypothetical protein